MHPNSLDLEAYAVGERIAQVEAHLPECADCRAFVSKLGALPPIAMPAPAKVVSLSSRVVRAAGVLVPLAAAALFFLFVRRHPGDVVPAPAPAPTGTLATPGPSPELEPDITFKGGFQIAVVRERDGSQERFTGHAPIRAGDRLRVEVAIDREQAISAGVLGDDGSWLELMSDGTRPPGTHFSERSARVDAEPLRGTVLAGPPAAVALARSTHSFDGVGTLRLEWETP